MNRVHDNLETTETESSSEEYTVHNVRRYSNDPVYVQMLINGKWLSMDMDTGAEVSIISDRTREEIFPEEKLQPSDLKLKTYTNEPMKVHVHCNRHTERKGPVLGSVQEVSISGYSW